MLVVDFKVPRVPQVHFLTLSPTALSVGSDFSCSIELLSPVALPGVPLSWVPLFLILTLLHLCECPLLRVCL